MEQAYLHGIQMPWIGGRSACYFRLSCEEAFLVVGTDLPAFGEYQYSSDGKSAASMAFPQQNLSAVIPGLPVNNEWVSQGQKGVAAAGLVCYAQFADAGASACFRVYAASSQTPPFLLYVLTHSTTPPKFKIKEITRDEL